MLFGGKSKNLMCFNAYANKFKLFYLSLEYSFHYETEHDYSQTITYPQRVYNIHT